MKNQNEQLEQMLTELSINQHGAIQVGRFIIQPIYGSKNNIDTQCMLEEFEYALNNIK